MNETPQKVERIESFEEPTTPVTPIAPTTNNSYNSMNTASMLTKDKKVVAFVGTSKTVHHSQLTIRQSYFHKKE